MAERIQEPFKSEKLREILEIIHKTDDPYLSQIAQQTELEIGAVQKYTETLIDQEWTQKHKDGRKQVFYLDIEQVLLDYLRQQEDLETYKELTEKTRKELLDKFEKEIQQDGSITDAILKATLNQIPY